MSARTAMARIRILAREIEEAEFDDDELIEANIAEIGRCLVRFECRRARK